jgi:hypothetical protein
MKLSTEIIEGITYTKVEGVGQTFSVKGVKSIKEVLSILDKIEKDSERFFTKVASISILEV